MSSETPPGSSQSEEARPYTSPQLVILATGLTGNAANTQQDAIFQSDS